ncbi:MAG TPA: hypothetical protein DCE44_09525 [Verrucomicrobiales bacterium]|nr:hypothetical protein [Verrucomicrobiales bacterium]
MRLVALTKALLVKWASTKDHWRDDQARQFEQTYLVELEAGVENTVGVIEQLDEMLTRLRSDCE